MSILTTVLELLDSAITAAEQTAGDLAEIKRHLSEHPEIDDSATAELAREFGEDSASDPD